MQTRQDIKIALSFADKIIEYTGWILLVLIWLLVAVVFFTLPATIPTHFNASGKPDIYGDKVNFLILPVLGTIIFTGMTVLNRFPWIFNYINYTYQNALQQYTYATKMIRTLKTTVIFVFLLINTLTFLTATGRITGLGRWLLPFVISLFLIPTTFYIIKSSKALKAH